MPEERTTTLHLPQAQDPFNRDNTPPLSGHDADDSSDWEYEYDQTTTQDFYFTIDLTTHMPSSSRKRKRPATPPPTRRRRRKPSVPATAETPPVADESALGVPEITNQINKNDRNEQLDDDQPAEPSPPIPGNNEITPEGLEEPDTRSPPASTPPPATRLQVLDLASSNPLISYQNQLYTCHWAQSIGTDLYIKSKSSAIASASASAADANGQSAASQSKPKVEIIGTSFLRLIAKPMHLIPRQSSISTTSSAQNATSIPSPPTGAGAGAGAAIRGQGKGSRGGKAGGGKTPQAQFLANLAAVRTTMGDTSTNPITRRASQATTAPVVAQGAISADNDDDDNDINSTPTTAILAQPTTGPVVLQTPDHAQQAGDQARLSFAVAGLFSESKQMDVRPESAATTSKRGRASIRGGEHGSRGSGMSNPRSGKVADVMDENDAESGGLDRNA